MRTLKIMASSQTPEASEIRRRGRQRLIGAVAIALLLIVFVPMLLDSEPRSARQEPALNIPPRDNAPPLPAPVASPPGEPKAATVTPSVPAEEKSAAPAAKVAVVPPHATPATKDPILAAARMEGFAVQVGAFRDEAKLQQAREKLAATKMTSYTEPSGELTRLRVGPFATREAADKAAATIRQSIPDAKVVPLP